MSKQSPGSAPLVCIVMGVCGSGKTKVGQLLAAKLGFVFHDADDFHPPENVALMRQGIPLDDEKRQPWLDRLRRLIDEAVVSRQGIVLACSALKRSYRLRMGGREPQVVLIHLDGSEALIRERLEQRTGHFMPASLLASQCALLERPTVDEAAIVADITPPPAVIIETILAALAAR
ncbi:MAG: gluconokinase [Planctomycetota bacterium]